MWPCPKRPRSLALADQGGASARRGQGALGATAAIAATLIAGCRGDPAPTPAPTPAGFELLSAGAEPRVPLRYHLTAGLRTRTTLRLRAQPVGVAAELPTLRLVTETELMAANPDGSFPVRVRVLEATTDPPATHASPTDAALASLRGTELHATASPTGKLREVAIEPSAGAGAAGQASDRAGELQSLSQAMQQLALELPLPKVGVGARWAIERPLEQPGLVFKSRTTYELLELTPQRARVHSEIHMTAPDQTVRQGELSAELTDLLGQGEGELTIDLGSLTATGEVTSSYHGQLTSEGKRTELGMELTVTMSRE